MKIGVVGPGAIGTFLAGVLSKNNEVDLLGKRDRDIETIEVTGETRLESSVNYTDSRSALSEDELIIICTKAFDTDRAIRSLSGQISSDSVVLSLQNGLNNEKVISRYVGEEKTIGGVTSNGVTFIESGKVKHAGVGETVIGIYPRGDQEIVDRVSRTFNDAGIETRISDEIIIHIWEKAVINSGINPLTAVLAVKNGLLVEDEYLDGLLEQIVVESARVAEKRVDTSRDKLVSRTKEVAEQTSENFSSMLQDIRNEKRTEVEQINGEIIVEGKELGISTPMNETLFNLVKFRENSYL